MDVRSVQIPGVQLGEELGRGAHSVAYRAYRAGRYYAVKIPLSDDPVEFERVARSFRQEAIALARVRHPVLPAVMEVGEAQGRPYLVMELVAGETLASRLRQGPLREHAVLSMASQLSDALCKTHQSGIYHGDISATNVLFDAHTSGVRLVDFGFAASTRPNDEAVDTRPDSPGPRLTGPQLDLYRLGCVLFECATGIALVTGFDPRPLLERRGDNKDLPPNISRGLSKVLRRLLLLDEAPYSNASLLSRDLTELWQGGEQHAASPNPSAAFGAYVLAPIVGREHELSCLRAAWHSATAGRHQVVLLRGGSGTGKTRLLRAFAEESTADGRLWFALVCSQTQREPFALPRRLLHVHLDEIDRLPTAKRTQAMAAFRQLAADSAPMLRVLSARLARIFAGVPPPPHGDGAEEMFAEALSDVVARLLSQKGPVILMIDDVQWLDPGSRQVLGRITDHRTTKTLVVLAARDDSDSWANVGHLTRRLDPERVWELTIEPLRQEGVSEVVATYLGQHRPDEELIRLVTTLSDGTPLNIIESVHAILDGGALVPYWGEWKFDAAVAAGLDIPKEASKLVARRVAALDDQVRSTLSAAAVLGTVFSTTLLARTRGTDVNEAAAHLADAQRALLVEAWGEQRHRFVHDSVREAVLGGLDASELRSLHDAAAKALSGQLDKRSTTKLTTPSNGLAAGNMALVYDIANHYSQGNRARHAKAVLSSCTDAGQLAFSSYDNELALAYFEVAAEATQRLSQALPWDQELTIAEALLRTGALEDSIKAFQQLAEHAPDPVSRAHVLSRIAWALTHRDRDRAWSALEAAFQTLGARFPSGSTLGLMLSIWAWLLWMISPRRTSPPERRRQLEVLCGLYYQVGRLASYTNKPTRMIEAALRCLAPAERLGPSGALSKSYLVYSFALTAFGARATGRRYLLLAKSTAEQTRDPVVYAHALQVHAVIAAWAGDIQDSLNAGASSLTEFGRWRELSDYCGTAYNQQQIEGVRGRNLDAWRWLERALARLNKQEAPPGELEFIEKSAKAALTALGRERDADVLLVRFRETGGNHPVRSALPAAVDYGSQVRIFTESGNLGPEFEALVATVEAQRFNPKRVHMELTEFYVHVAHARVHACLRAHGGASSPELDALRTALADLEAGARIPLLRAHALVVRAYLLFFEGNHQRANEFFARAQELGEREGAPWVLYAVYRGRAHLLRNEGLVDSARDQARLAEAIAKEHRAAYRLRWIRQEFGLRHHAGGETGSYSSSSPRHELGLERGRSRSSRYLKSLTRIDQQTDLSQEQQARVVVDELVEALTADRGFLFLAAEWDEDLAHAPRSRRDSERDSGPGHGLVLLAARSAVGEDLASTDCDTSLVEDLFVFGEPEGSHDDAFGTAVLTAHGDHSVLAVPLIMRGALIGVVYLDRPRRAQPFTEAERASLTVLADQIPLVFELGRSLRARDRAEENQRSAEKLEAVGRLAGGIAHDFNNMLSVIVSASEQISTYENVKDTAADVETIQSAAARARDLTRQLLSFSRGQYLNPEVIDLNELIARLESVFRRLLGSASLELELDPELCRVEADPAQIDQVLTNLIVNAGDAMSGGGSLRIQTQGVTVTGSREDPSGLRPGRYARVLVSDTGQGMDQATLSRAFEPFFTTKAARSGTGLGLATAYGIITQSGGHITVESQVGVGTTFRIFLPEAQHRSLTVPPPVSQERRSSGNETILLVDDEPLVRNATRRLLRSLGYNVMVAESGEAALEIADQHADEIDLVLTDVVMPQLNGLELARELSRRKPSLRVLFMSGFADGVLAERGVIQPGVVYLQKPINREALAHSLRHVLDRGAA